MKEFDHQGLIKFAALVAAKASKEERDACEKVCISKAEAMEREANSENCEKDDVVSLRSSAWLISVCAALIRGRGK